MLVLDHPVKSSGKLDLRQRLTKTFHVRRVWLKGEVSVLTPSTHSNKLNRSRDSILFVDSDKGA